MRADREIKIERRRSVAGEDLLLTIGVDQGECDKEVQGDILCRLLEEDYRGTPWDFAESVRETEPEFYRAFVENTPRQDGYLFGSLAHAADPPRAVIESLFVKPRFRGRGYARRLISRFLEEADGHCYPVYGRVAANEKPEDFRWKLGEGGRTSSPNYPSELEPGEFNERQGLLLDLYDDFGFEVTGSGEDSEGRQYYWGRREARC
jgi:GNAT superfamily N-acetyltransferase